jgi:hypothetical protein
MHTLLAKSLLILTLLFSLLFGGESSGIDSSTTVVDSTHSIIENQDSTTTAVADTVAQEPVSIHKKSRRYRIVGAILMMIFIGVALGTTQSMNPR